MMYEIGGLKFSMMAAAQEKAREWSRKNRGTHTCIMRDGAIVALYIDGVRFVTPAEPRYFK